MELIYFQKKDFDKYLSRTIEWYKKNNYKFDNKKISMYSSSNTAVILAGGQGTRLQPYTSVFPKPLFQLGENQF